MSTNTDYYGIDLKAIAIRALNASTPRNNHGLPVGIYRPDLLPEPEELVPTSDVNLVRPSSDVEPPHSMTDEPSGALHSDVVGDTNDSSNSNIHGLESKAPQVLVKSPKIVAQRDSRGNPETLESWPLSDRTGNTGATKAPSKSLSTAIDQDGEFVVFPGFWEMGSEGGLVECAPNPDSVADPDDGSDVAPNLRLPAPSSLPSAPSGSSSTANSVGTVRKVCSDPPLGIPERYLLSAFIPLNYDEGFPALPDGRPFWTRLDYEPTESYHLFSAYLAQRGVRQLHKLASEINMSVRELREYFYLYYWDERARAYELFQAVEMRRRRAERLLSIEDEHFLAGERLLDVVRDYLEDEDRAQELLEQMNPKLLAELTKVGSQVQRVAIGLPAAGPPDVRRPDDGVGASVEVISRTLAKKHGSVEEEGGSKTIDSATLEALYEDPESVELAQQLVIRVHTGRRE